MRGEHEATGKRGGRDSGIIPACAGSTASNTNLDGNMPGSSPHARGAPLDLMLLSVCVRDHPRMRGEHRVPDHVLELERGIIPACAGSTPFF